MSATTKQKSLVDRLFHEAFDANTHRDPRSAAYKAGVRALLDFKANGVRVVCPYGPATAEADAFSAGTSEGHSIWRRHLDRQADKPEGAV